MESCWYKVGVKMTSMKSEAEQGAVLPWMQVGILPCEEVHETTGHKTEVQGTSRTRRRRGFGRLCLALPRAVPASSLLPTPGRHPQPPFLVGNEWARLHSAEAQAQGSDWERGPNPPPDRNKSPGFRDWADLKNKIQKIK